MKLLQLALKPPYPKIDGGCVAIAKMAEDLTAKGVHVSSISISTDKHPFEREQFPEKWLQSIATFNTYVDTSPSYLLAFFNLFSPKSYIIKRFHSKKLAQFLSRHLQENPYDVVQLESSYLLPYFSTIRKNSQAKIVLRSHNLEHQLLQQKAQKSSFFSKLYLQLQANRMKREELKLAQSCDGIVAISSYENIFFTENTNTKCIYIPLAIQVSTAEWNLKTDFFHIGAMDWTPNREGVDWFLKQVWSQKKLDKQQLHLAGKSIGTTIHKGYQQVINHGEVADAKTFMHTKGIMVVPLFSGSGIRIKILEAGSLGIPIIATQKAVEGLKLKNGQDYLEANDSASFLAEMQRLEADVDLQQKLSVSIRKTIEQHYDTQELTRQLLAFYQTI